MRKSTQTALGEILLADDEPAILLTFKAVLEDAGFRVRAVPTLEEARESVRKGSFDAIISDFSLEREGLGLELAREAKKLSKPPAVVLYTGNPTEERLRAALNLPVDYFAFQPIDIDEIRSALFRLISRRSNMC
ncbi:MAG TPA: response regulator [Terriglobales bacterium]|nr:response regulator [Terriglobales bacterium]